MSLCSNPRSQAAAAAAPDPAQVSVQAPPDADPDHHLWRNGRLWWIAFTVHRGHQQERVRLSLGTDALLVARARRDALLALFARARAASPGSSAGRASAARGRRAGGGVAMPAGAKPMDGCHLSGSSGDQQIPR
jgi:hypothetical protein